MPEPVLPEQSSPVEPEFAPGRGSGSDEEEPWKPWNTRSAGDGLSVEPEDLYIHDHTGKKYICPWSIGKEWTSFKSFVEDIYAHRDAGDDLDAIRNARFDVKRRVLGNDNIVLPSVWSTIVNPGDTVRIFIWDPLPGRRFSIPRRDTAAEFRPEISREERGDRPIRVRAPDTRYSPSPPPPPARRRGTAPAHLEDDDDSVGEEESSVTEDEEESTEPPPPPPEQVRVSIPPADQEGNPLSFPVDTKWIATHSSVGEEQGSSGDSSKKPTTSRDMGVENLKITKAVTFSSDGRTGVQIHTLPGPETPAYSSAISIQWYHLHSDQLDWTQFKSTCLGLPGLSERLQKVIKKTLQKVEKEYLKAFLDGMFIEPGTVLRGDETKQPDSQSVIFSCIPYFDIRKPTKNNGQSDRLHPPRTLMQTYYPYEPVRERDDDQAFRKFGNDRGDRLIHVPSLWMLNVSSHAVVTCGYQQLSSDFTKSIEVLKEDLKQLTLGFSENSLTAIRLTDWDGRVLLYKPQECETYFQMHQKMQEARYVSKSPDDPEVVPRLFWNTQEGRKKITPGLWLAILRQRNSIFIDVSVEYVKRKDANVAPDDSEQITTQSDSVPPFFQWPKAGKDDPDALRFLPTDVKRSVYCLEHVEKAMTAEILDRYATTGAVDETFTSAEYYESLAEDTFANVYAPIDSLTRKPSFTSQGKSHSTHHQFVVESTTPKVGLAVRDFVDLVHATLKLFVSDVDSTTMLRKVWGAMARIIETVERIQQIEPLRPDPEEYKDPYWRSPNFGRPTWRIRTKAASYLPTANLDLPLPGGDDELAESVKKCKRCRRERPYRDPNQALEHLHGHVEAANPGQVKPHEDKEKLKAWIYNSDEILVESTVAGTLCILNAATLSGRELYRQLKDLMDGVRKEDGKISELYTFPRKLLETLRRLLIFYFAVERSLHYTELNFQNPVNAGRVADVPFTKDGLDVLKRFSEGVQMPLLLARVTLLDMARSPTPDDYWERLSLGPEYICGWFMRRLIVKPLQNSMTVADMYREYLSTLQFQVNHRPNKRLLRSITLLQEELTILSAVNEWQTRLIENYSRVLADASYPIDIPSRRAMYPYERLLLKSCLESLAISREEYADQIRRCGPLSESTKQSAEINEEDHGKAILVFTLVTIIFLPLSFVTSYLGMNTSDIRNLSQNQTLFWEIAIPLTVVVMGTILFIAYNGDELRDRTSSIYRAVTGKQNRSSSARGISVAERKRASKGPADSSSTLDSKTLATEAEYASPQPDFWEDNIYSKAMPGARRAMGSYWDERDEWYKPGDEYISYDLASRRRPVRPTGARVPNVTIYNSRVSRMGRQSSPSPPPPPPPPPPLANRMAPYGTNPFAPTGTNPFAPPATAPTAPTYTRINRNHVTPEALTAFGLPWQRDPQDSNYYLIKKEMSRDETDMLFAQARARRLKRAAEAGGYEEPDEEWGYYGAGRARRGYTWTNQRKRDRVTRARRMGSEESLDRYGGYRRR